MFEDRTTENLKKETLAQINEGLGVSTMAGSYADGVVGPVCQMVSSLYKALPGVLSMLFVDASSGPFLDLVAGDYLGLTRLEGTKASCGVTFTGTPGTRIPQGTRFLTKDALVFNLDTEVTIGDSGSAVGHLTAQAAGSAYNIPLGSLTGMQVNLPGLDGYVNDQATGGTDRESDAALYARIAEARQRPRTSGNGWDYRQWAMEVDGVGQAKVVELAQGPGTVGVTVVDGSYSPVGDEILQAVKDNIAASRPIGASVTVETADALELSISAEVDLSSSTLEEVKTLFISAMEDYLEQLVESKYGKVYYGPEEDLPYILYYNRVLSILMTIPGVDTLDSLLVNGGTNDLQFQPGQVPELGEVTLR